MNLRSIVKNLDKTKKNIKYIIPVVCIAIIIYSCNSPTEPKKDNNTPPDTTSHSFTWQTFEFGDDGAGSSFLKDVTIVNDSDIWAVGAIYLNDSTGQPDYNAYNALNWNGNEWNIKRLKYYGNCSAVEYPSLNTIWGFSKNNILISNGGSIGWFDGNSVNLDCDVNKLITGAINKAWGISDNDLYICGNDGNIVHYYDYKWIKIITGTTANLVDIWGKSDGSIWVCGYAMDYSQSCILKFDGIDWKTIWSTHAISTPPYGYFVSTIWTGDTYLYVGTGDGIYRTSLKGNDSTEKVLSLQLGPHRIRGSAENNIAIAVDDGSIWHYNGATWFQETPTVLFRPLYSIAVSENTIVGVGFDATKTNIKGIIIMGRRN